VGDTTSAALTDRKARPALPRHETKGLNMKLTILALSTILAVPALADTRVTRAIYTLPAYVEMVGCVIVDKGGYTIVRAADGVSFCEGMKGYNVEAGQQYVADRDGNPGTVDPGYVRDNN
jgi:hypothetical protein